MANPFEDENGVYLVLVNGEGQYSLWPSFVDVPAGWTVAKAEDSRQACVDFVNENWTDMRPQSLIEAMASEADRSVPDPGAPSPSSSTAR